MIQKLKEARENKNWDVAELISHFYKKYMEFQTSEELKIELWKGKSGIKLEEYPDKFICITFKKCDKGEEPQEIKKEILKSDLNNLIIVLNSFEDKVKIPTSLIAEKYYHKSWKHEIYGTRDLHISLCYMLNILEQREKIKYSRRGFTTIIKDLDYFKII